MPRINKFQSNVTPPHSSSSRSSTESPPINLIRPKIERETQLYRNESPPLPRASPSASSSSGAYKGPYDSASSSSGHYKSPIEPSPEPPFVPRPQMVPNVRPQMPLSLPLPQTISSPFAPQFMPNQRVFTPRSSYVQQLTHNDSNQSYSHSQNEHQWNVNYNHNQMQQSIPMPYPKVRHVNSDEPIYTSQMSTPDVNNSRTPTVPTLSVAEVSINNLDFKLIQSILDSTKGQMKKNDDDRPSSSDSIKKETKSMDKLIEDLDCINKQEQSNKEIRDKIRKSMRQLEEEIQVLEKKKQMYEQLRKADSDCQSKEDELMKKRVMITDEMKSANQLSKSSLYKLDNHEVPPPPDHDFTKGPIITCVQSLAKKPETVNAQLKRPYNSTVISGVKKSKVIASASSAASSSSSSSSSSSVGSKHQKAKKVQFNLKFVPDDVQSSPSVRTPTNRLCRQQTPKQQPNSKPVYGVKSSRPMKPGISKQKQGENVSNVHGPQENSRDYWALKLGIGSMDTDAETRPENEDLDNDGDDLEPMDVESGNKSQSQTNHVSCDIPIDNTVNTDSFNNNNIANDGNDRAENATVESAEKEGTDAEECDFCHASFGTIQELTEHIKKYHVKSEKSEGLKKNFKTEKIKNEKIKKEIKKEKSIKKEKNCGAKEKGSDGNEKSGDEKTSDENKIPEENVRNSEEIQIQIQKSPEENDKNLVESEKSSENIGNSDENAKESDTN